MAGKRLDPSLVRRVMDLLADGASPAEAARRTGVSKTLVYRMHGQAGGVYRPSRTQYSDRFLSREERYEIAG
jgi:DNA invertase Pin-like site-specific DNA recombinase